MSEVSNLALALKKNKTTVTELKAAVERELNEAMSEIDALIRHTENLENILKEKWQITENKEKTISDLEIEITNFEGEKAQLETQITSRKEELLGLGREKDNLQSQLEQKQTELDGAKRKLDQLTQDTKDQRELITKLEGDLENIKNEHERAIADLRAAYENENMRVSQIQAQHKALRFLLQKKLIKMPELAVIDSMVGKQSLTVDYLQKTTLSKASLIESVVSGLAKRGVLDYNPASGEITVKKEIKT
ncbi:MAG: hypothetical protein ACFE7E_04815 [Candidatus Hodarchaeota archaeon]